MEFITQSPKDTSDVIEVRYDCDCGCKPRARYQKGTDEANYEHCCCGLVHFVGTKAEERLKTYLDERSNQGMDAEVGGYSIHTQEVESPWGEPVAVAYAVPAIPKAH